MPGKATLEQTDAFYKQTISRSPSYTMATKQDIVIGGNVPSWTNSVPGPKYNFDTNAYKCRQPVHSLGAKLDMVVGGDVPSWKSSIPGPYSFDPDVVRKRQPVYSMGGRSQSATERRSSSTLAEGGARLTTGFKMISTNSPSWSLNSRPDMVIGGDVPSWKQSIPGPYDCNPDVVKAKQPNFTIGRKLPTESDMMKARSPGPMRYGEAAMDVHKQTRVDSTKRRAPAPSFGSVPRWEGQAAEMARAGCGHRYERPVLR